MLKIILLTVSIVCSIYSCYSQSSNGNLQQDISKNTIQASAGFCGLFGAYNVTYERLILPFERNTLVGLWATGGFGGWGAMYHTGGPFQHVSVGVLTGKRNGHFELNLGAARMYNKIGLEHNGRIRDQQVEPEPRKKDYVHANPVGSAGYRYQKPSGGFVFRCGLGYPESVYFGVGIGF